METDTTKVASGSTAPLEIICESFRHFSKNTLIGFVVLSFPAVGLRIHDVAVHVSADRKMWVGWPSREKNGSWVRVVEAMDKSSHYRLQAVAVKSIQKFLDQLQTPAPAARPAPATKKEPASEQREVPHAEIPI